MGPLIVVLAIPSLVALAIAGATSWAMQRRRAVSAPAPDQASAYRAVSVPDLALASLVVPVVVFGLIWGVADRGMGLGFYWMIHGLEAPAAFVMGLLYAGASCAAGAAGVIAYRVGVAWKWRVTGLVGVVLCFAVAAIVLLLLWFIPWWAPRYDNDH
jgi:hypothetical protein